jgi:hypothetical protein
VQLAALAITGATITATGTILSSLPNTISGVALRERMCDACGRTVPDDTERVQVRFRRFRMLRNFHKECWDLIADPERTSALMVRNQTGPRPMRLRRPDEPGS